MSFSLFHRIIQFKDKESKLVLLKNASCFIRIIVLTEMIGNVGELKKRYKGNIKKNVKWPILENVYYLGNH